MDTSNLEKATAGEYDFKIGAIFSEAWQKVRGVKGRLWLGILAFIVILIVCYLPIFYLNTYLVGSVDLATLESGTIPVHPVAQLLQLSVSIFIAAPLMAGILMIAIKHCVGINLPVNSMFQYFRYWNKLWVFPIVFAVLAVIGNFFVNSIFVQLVLLLVYIFIAVSYFMYVPLIVEKQLSIWNALEVSRKTIFHHWFKTAGLIILLTLIIVASLFTLGIALIWTIPWCYVTVAVLYRNMFGIRES